MLLPTLVFAGHDQNFWAVAKKWPTLFEKVDPSLRLAQDEIFGPVAIVHNFNKEEEAIELANSFDTGLVAGIYSQNITKSLNLAKDFFKNS